MPEIYINTVMLIAIFAAVFFTNRRKTADSAQGSAIVALQAEIGALKDANHRLEVSLTEYKGKVEALELHNRQLSDMVAARPEWQLLMGTVEKQAETSKRIDGMLDNMDPNWQKKQEEHLRKTDELYKQFVKDE